MIKPKHFFLLFALTCITGFMQAQTESSTIKINESDSRSGIIEKAAHVVPTPNQYAALQNEFIAFIHFGPNTFTRKEWGTGMEAPQIFNLQNLDTDQWCRAMKAAGMKMVVFTAKHHDGFCLWQSRYTEHGVMSSPFKDGKGDVLKELSESCQKYGLKLGVYLSPADLYQIENPKGLYGNLSKYTERVIPRPVKDRPFENKTTFRFVVDDYNEYFLNQLFELLTEYGPIHEVWFDGAHPKRKGGQTYHYPAWKELIQTLAPEAVIFGRQDIRWCGNESGRTRDTEWNIIPYQKDPNEMNRFDDITAASIGSREDLYRGKFLHYQPAETNTSIREGWFYRDEMDQKVRSADDVFDMYERSVGGNSIFLLNIPPNREGEFSPEDVGVLEEAGQRIRETYGQNLLAGAKGPANVLDEDGSTFEVLNDDPMAIVITAPGPITTNRFVIQEAITTHSERIESHALDAWIDGGWKEIASATNVGYKRILRFPVVVTTKFRIRVLESRLNPAIASVSAHYYKTRPPQLEISRDVAGMVSIQPKTHTFRWKVHREDVVGNINRGMEIRFTTDGSTPTIDSRKYAEPFFLPSGEIKARAIDNKRTGSIASGMFGIVKQNWKLLGLNSEKKDHKGVKAFDGNAETYWLSGEIKKQPAYLSLDLGEVHDLKGFAYTPQTENSEGMIEKGLIKISEDGRPWKTISAFEFGNLINDPTTRRHYFDSVATTRYIRIEPIATAGGGKSASIAEIDFLEASQPGIADGISILKHYDKDHLFRVALPLGGIGTGTVSLGGRGELRDWEIMNVPAKGYSTVTTGNDAPFFAIYTQKKDAPAQTKALLGPLDDAEYQHYEGRSVDHHGLPRFKNAAFDATYPFGIVNLSDESMPVRVKLLGYNPLVPGDADASGIPIAILQYEVENTSPDQLEVAISGNIRNFIGKDGSEHTSNWKGDFIPVGAKQNVNEYRKSDAVSGIYMYSKEVDKDHSAWGTMALTTPLDDEGNITYRTSSAGNAWGNALLDFWDDFSADGLLTEKDRQIDQDPMASLALQKTIEAGEKKVFTFYLTWHFPNRFAWSKTRVGNYYTTQYSDAWEVIEKEVDRLPELTHKTRTFVNTLVNSSYPEVVKEAALFNVSTLRSQTVFRIEDGKMFGWEGVMDRFGSCFGSCTHVWNYEQATAFLFGELARTMREVEFGYATNEEGRMSFRTMLPLEKSQDVQSAAADGQMGTIMKFYRDWQLSGDQQFLGKHWPMVKSALAFAWIKGGWDADQDGVMEGVQHNTMDVEYFGPNPQMQIWYLGALKAGAQMAWAMKDQAFAEKCKRLFQYGSKWTDENLFNGEYYIHQIQTPASKADIAPSLMAGMGTKNLENPDYQLATGCLVDQLVGQYMAHVLGLGYLVKEENVRTTLGSILRYNKKEDMFDHFNNMRSYALGDEKALLMASWPKGGRPKIPFPYWAEVMTGFEYTAAIGMLYEGMEQEGLETIQNIRDRYDGKKRNPFDEAECGHHYARAMASWAALLAESGFHYSGIDKTIEFTSKPGRYFWSNGSSWGECVIEKRVGKTHAAFSVLHGELVLKEFRIEGLGSTMFEVEKRIVAGERIGMNL